MPRSPSRLTTRLVGVAMICALTFVAASCGSSSDSADTTASAGAAETTAATDTTAAPATDVAADTTAAADTAATTDAATASTAPANTTTGTGYLVSLENGDRACYVGIATAVDSDAEAQQLPGVYELCPGGKLDASLFIGSQVTYRTTKAKIAAVSCQGEPNCLDTELVDLVVEVLPTTTPGSTTDTDALQIEGLPLDTTAAAIVAKLGEPASKTPVEEEGATGEFVSTWKWDDKGVTAKMAAATKDGTSVVRSLTIYAPSDMKTAQGIALGDTADKVRSVYGKQINAEESKPDTIVVGSIFGGMIITTTGDKVTGIFVGAAAE